MVSAVIIGIFSLSTFSCPSLCSDGNGDASKLSDTTGRETGGRPTGNRCRHSRRRRQAVGIGVQPRSAPDQDASQGAIGRSPVGTLGTKPADEHVFKPALRHLADRIASRLRAGFRPGRTVTVRVRFADLRLVTRAVTLDAPIRATAILAEIAEELVRKVLADHPGENIISLLAISVSHLETCWDMQLAHPPGLDDEKRRPGTRRGMARWSAERAMDTIRDRFGWEAVGYGSVALGLSRSVPDAFRELAGKPTRALAAGHKRASRSRPQPVRKETARRSPNLAGATLVLCGWRGHYPWWLYRFQQCLTRVATSSPTIRFAIGAPVHGP